VKIQFELNMKEAVVNDKLIDQITIIWPEELTAQEVIDISIRWMVTKYFLVNRMDGLQKVKESTLTIQPINITV
jgi:hypothetical protein